MIYNNFNLINEWSIINILYNITFLSNLIFGLTKFSIDSSRHISKISIPIA